MPRIVWLTDIHLNFVDQADAGTFYESVRASGPDAVMLGGDIGEAHDVERYMAQLDDELGCPVHFVLGNHDFYRGSIAGVREAIARLCTMRPRLNYLTQSPPVALAPAVGLVGHDGWADARLGDYERSYVMMNDYRLIAELAGVGKQERWPLLQALGDAAAAWIGHVLPLALQTYPQVYLLTHVPPWREACWYQGRLSDDEWAPHFACKAMGDAIHAIMSRFPDRQLTVLCGHTHGAGEAQPAPNIRVFTAAAEYGRPEIAGVFDF
jgi:Icc protein